MSPLKIVFLKKPQNQKQIEEILSKKIMLILNKLKQFLMIVK